MPARRRRARVVGAAAVLGMIGPTVGLAASAAAAARADNDVVFEIQSAEIDESSSLAVSTTEPHLVYTTNDSGDSARVYVLDDRTGALVGTTTLDGVDAIDVEALAAGADGTLVVADIGDNNEVHPSVEVYRIDQPGRGDHTVIPDVASLRYPGGPRDAEGALYDSDTGRVYVVSKRFPDPRVYRTPPNVFDRGQAVLEPVAAAPRVATDATFLPGGDVAVIRTYLDAVFYAFPSWKRLASIRLPLQPQGESIAAPDDEHIWVGSEGVHTNVLSVAVPDLTPTTPTEPTDSTGAPSDPGAAEATPGGDHSLAARNIVIGSGALLAVVIAIGVVRYRRHHPHDD